MRRATGLDVTIIGRTWISIHALLAESDTGNASGIHTHWISIHALLAESDLPRPTPCPSRGRFLSTLSLRRATRTGYQGRADRPHFYPRSPCGERPAGPDRQGAGPGISIHALLAESDRFTISAHCLDSRISIHALLAESDPFLRSDPMMRRYFYPRSPCGERLEEVSGDTWQRDFYPRSPCGERLNELLEQSASYHISIHALLAESDRL